LIEQPGSPQPIEHRLANDVAHAAQVAGSSSVKRLPHGGRNPDGDDSVAARSVSVSIGGVH
jgi:hypothetical protein